MVGLIAVRLIGQASNHGGPEMLSPSRRSVLIGGLAGAAITGLPLPAAYAVGSYDNGALADYALRFVGQKGGQCRAFVNRVTRDVGGQNTTTGGGDYFLPFERAGGQRITDIAQLVKGDIVQVGQNERASNLHTFIVIRRISGNVFEVVDSNAKRDEIVRRYNRGNVTLDNTRRAYRMGSLKNSTSTSIGQHFVYLIGSSRQLHVTHWTGNAWQTDNFGLQVASGTSPSAYRGSNGQHFVYWVSTDGVLHVNHWTGTRWQVDNLSQPVRPGTDPSAYLAENGEHFVYYVGSDGALRTTHWTGNAWQTDNFGLQVASGTSPSAYRD